MFDKLHTAPMPDVRVRQRSRPGRRAASWRCTAHYRTVSAAAAGIALPECFLGMFPGWGGAYLLPNLIGADRAVTVIIENALSQNRMLDGPQAASSSGIADALFDGADFLERSLDWAGRVVAGDARRRAAGDRPGRGLGRGRGPRPGLRRRQGRPVPRPGRTGRWS